MEEKKSYFKWGEFLSYYKPFRGIFAADMFFAFLGALTTLVIPLIVRYITGKYGTVGADESGNSGYSSVKSESTGRGSGSGESGVTA